MNTAAKWPCVAANKSQKRKQNVKKEKAFLSVKGIYLGSPVLPFFPFLFKQFRPPPPVSLILHMFRHEVFSYFINGSLFSYQRRIFFFFCIYVCPLCAHPLSSMSYLFLLQPLFILNNLAQIPLPPPQSLSRLCLCWSSHSWNDRVII